MLANSDNQLFKTTDVLSITLACTFIFLLCFKIGWSFYTPKFMEIVKAEAIINAYQILEIEAKYTRKSKEQVRLSRGLASNSVVKKQGIVGIDPWSSPYQYRIQTGADLNRQIVVWSSGPDGKNNSNETIPNFSSDDIGESLVINF